MTFGYLLSTYHFDEIVEEFRALWQINAPKQAEHLDLGGWRKIYQSLQAFGDEAFAVLYPFGVSMGRLQPIDRHELRCT